MKRRDAGPFRARLDFAELGVLQISRMTQSALRSEAPPSAACRHGLIRPHAQCAPGTLARFSEISIDLVVASIAERLARDVPQPVHGTLVVEDAEAYGEAHRHGPDLDPPRLAGALGLSLRRLQELFR